MTRIAALAVCCLLGVLGCQQRGPILLDRAAVSPARSGDPARLERLRRATAALDGARVRIRDSRLSARGGIGAWSWPDGRLEMTRALIDRLDDAALVAAVAHELGHLLDHAPGGPTSDAIDGGAGAGERREERADRIGCTLLASRGVPPSAMLRVLDAIADAGVDGASLARRRAAATASCADGAAA